MEQIKEKSLSSLSGITERIIKRHKPRRVVLFGSYAWGTPHKDSDIDLLVVTDTDDTRATARAIDASLFPRTLPIDIVVTTPQKIDERRSRGDLFIEHILSKGRVLYERER